MLMIPNRSPNDPYRIVIFRQAEGKLFDSGPMSLDRFGLVLHGVTCQFVETPGHWKKMWRLLSKIKHRGKFPLA